MHYNKKLNLSISIGKVAIVHKMGKFMFAFFFIFLLSESNAQTSKKYSVYFDVNQSKIKPKDYIVLDSVVTMLKTKVNLRRIQINGYADTTGGAAANMELSDRRTDTVANYIIGKGLSQYKGKVATSSLGEKVTGKEADLDEMRRVDIILFMAKLDRDTIIRNGCMTVFVPAGTFDGFNNDEINFKLEYISKEADTKKPKLFFKDENGGPIVSNGVVKLIATYKGKPLKAIKPITISIPKVNKDDNYFVYKAIEDKFKNITFKSSTQKVNNVGVKTAPNGDVCDLISFDIDEANKYFNAAKNSACYCNSDPFGGLLVPEKSNPLAKFGPMKSITLLSETSFKKVAADKVYVQVEDNLMPEEYLTFCNSFMFPGLANIPNIPKYEREVLRFIDVNVSQKNDSADLIMSKKDMVLIMIPKSQLPAHAGKKYALLPAETKKDNFLKWTVKPVFVDSCRGLANCEYVIFEVPFTGFYTLLELTPVNGKDNKASDNGDEAPKGKNVKIKVKKFNGATVMYGSQEDNKTYDAKFIRNKGKHSILEPAITKKEKKNYKQHVFMAYVVKEGKRYAWIGKGSKLKSGFLSGNWKTPKLVYVPDEEWESFVKNACQ